MLHPSLSRQKYPGKKKERKREKKEREEREKREREKEREDTEAHPVPFCLWTERASYSAPTTNHPPLPPVQAQAQAGEKEKEKTEVQEVQEEA